MAVTLRIKRSEVTATPPSLAPGELAYSEQSGNFFIGNALNDPVVIGGTDFRDASKLTGTLPAARLTGTYNISISGNATTATALATARTISLSGDINGSGNFDGSGNLDIAATLPNVVTAGTKAKITYNAKGQVTGGEDLTAADIPTLTAAKISDFASVVHQQRLDQMAAPTQAVSMNNQRLTSLAAPVAGNDAATRDWVLNVASGLRDPKDAVRVTMDTNVNIASPGATLQGVTMAVGDRVALVGQTSAHQNGIYTWQGATSPMVRSTDANESAEVTQGMSFTTMEGTNQGKTYALKTPDPITLGSTALEFVVTGSAVTYSAGDGLALNGSTFSAVGTAGRITVTANGIDISNTYAGQTSITTLGTITTGTWQGTPVGLAYGGTGASTAAGARTALGLGSMAQQSHDNVNIDGGTIDGVVLDGGTF